MCIGVHALNDKRVSQVEVRGGGVGLPHERVNNAMPFQSKYILSFSFFPKLSGLCVTTNLYSVVLFQSYISLMNTSRCDSFTSSNG